VRRSVSHRSISHSLGKLTLELYFSTLEMMKLSTARLKGLCTERGVALSGLLREAGVSRTAYYSLARKDSVLPKSIEAVARRLDVPASEFLEDERRVEAEARALLDQANEIARTYRSADLDNIRHTLLLLKKEPIERLRRSLLRAQTAHTHRPRTGLPARTS
jgi:transcriptional regulator with XRE-family HTH domain